jgi:hypothetical protein
MKKKMLLFLFIVLIAALSGCSLTEASYATVPSESGHTPLLQVPALCNRLWNFRIGQEGYVGSSRYYFANWSCAGIYLDLTIRPDEFADPSYKKYESTIVDGVTCYVQDSKLYVHGATNSTSWQSPGGLLLSRNLAYEQNDLVCYLSGQTTIPDASLNVISLKTAQSLMAGMAAQVPGCEQKTESWSIEFKKGEISVHVSIVPHPFASQAYQQDWVNAKPGSLMHDGDLEYYFVKSEGDTVDSPNYASLACLSDIGLIVIRGGVPELALSGTPRDEFSFINIDLVKKILADFK